jgi:inner membrane protein
MQKRFLFKILTIGLLFLLLEWPLSMIEGLINERTQFRVEARNSIAQSWTGEQAVIGPVLVVPYQVIGQHQVWDEHLKSYRTEPLILRKHLHILPDKVEVRAQVQTEERKRGLYAVPVYTAEMALSGRFTTAALGELAKEGSAEIKFEPAFVSLMIPDLRGIVEQPRLQWQGKEIEFLSGSRAFTQMAGMHSVVGDLDPQATESFDFSTKISLRGMEQIRFSPVGKSTHVNLQSPWPHPSFFGRYLPIEHKIDDQGFSARWQASSFSGDIKGELQACGQGQCGPLLNDVFGVSFITPVDIYQQSERSVKYGTLFIGLTFVAFFLFEVMRRLRLHPMHYLLVGMALAVFYLLLISLSEHLGFGPSYLAATLGCTGLLAFYIGGVMHSPKLGLMFAGKFLLLYGMLYAILRSEDNALLMGSLLVFAVLGLVMVLTRKLDWYRVGEQMGRIAVPPRQEEPVATE